MQAEVRERVARDVPERLRKTRVCVDCKQPFLGNVDDDRRYCAQCGAARNMNGTEQMSRRMGPVYEKAVRGQLRFWLSEAARLGITLD